MDRIASLNEVHIRLALSLISFAFLAFLIFKPRQNAMLNWAMFYATLWVALSLPIVNYICVRHGYWQYISDKRLVLQIPLDLYFSWVVIWGATITYFLKSRFVFTSLLGILWLDIIYMPLMEKYSLLSLSSDWLIGEIAILIVVLLPARLWARWSLDNKSTAGRALLQVVCMSLLLFGVLPFAVHQYAPLDYDLSSTEWMYLSQVVFMLALPALTAVRDLVALGKGTPFPYDKTKNLVTIGVYAYIRNPIQWSTTVLFISLAWFFNSPLLLLGSLVSVAYALSIAWVHEGSDMVSRFGGSWVEYKSRTPQFRFLWKPNKMGQATIYFKEDCLACQNVKRWFVSRKPINLDFQDATDDLRQVTYIDDHANKSASVLAISYALGHINLLYASLGWLMRFPGVCFLLQLIVDATIPPAEVGCPVDERL